MRLSQRLSGDRVESEATMERKIGAGTSGVGERTDLSMQRVASVLW